MSNEDKVAHAPTEDRSSNTEMVSAPPYIGLEPLVGRYYPALCRRCGWVGSSEELTEEDAQCTRDAGDRLCLGDCDELGPDDLLGIIQAMAKAAPQHQGEPAALPGRKSYVESFSAHGQGQIMGWNACLDEIAKLGPLYNHTDPAEVERLRDELVGSDHAFVRIASEAEQLRAQLAEANALLARVVNSGALSSEQHEELESECCALSASSPKCKTCHDHGEVFVRKGDVHYGMQSEPEPVMAACPDCAAPTVAISASAEPSAPTPMPAYMEAVCDKFDWTPGEALRFYAEGKHFDTDNGRTRILCTGAIASHALKGMSKEYADLKGSEQGEPSAPADRTLVHAARVCGVAYDSTGNTVSMEIGVASMPIKRRVELGEYLVFMNDLESPGKLLDERQLFESALGEQKAFPLNSQAVVAAQWAWQARAALERKP